MIPLRNEMPAANWAASLEEQLDGSIDILAWSRTEGFDFWYVLSKTLEPTSAFVSDLTGSARG